MVQTLSERVEEQLRQFVADNIDSSAMQGYDPQQDNPSATDYLPVTNDWSTRGNYYPMIFVGETEGPVVPNSGNTNVNSIQGDGSGANQFSVHNITISVQVAEGGAYLNSTDYDDLAHDIYQEVKQTIQNNRFSAVSDAQYVGIPTPPTPTRDPEGDDQSDTLNWYQLQGTVPVGILDEP